MFQRTKKKNSPESSPVPAVPSAGSVRLTEEELAAVQAGKSREIVVVGSKVKESL